MPWAVILKTVPSWLVPRKLSRKSSRRWLAPGRRKVVAVSDVEAVERGQRAAGGDFEDRPLLNGGPPSLVVP